MVLNARVELSYLWKMNKLDAEMIEKADLWYFTISWNQ